MKLIELFYRCLISIQIKVQHIAVFFALIIAEIVIIFVDFSILIAIPEIGPAILPLLIIIYFWRKIKNHSKYKMFVGIINSLIFWNYTFLWVYPYPNKKNKY